MASSSIKGPTQSESGVPSSANWNPTKPLINKQPREKPARLAIMHDFTKLVRSFEQEERVDEEAVEVTSEVSTTNTKSLGLGVGVGGCQGSESSLSTCRGFPYYIIILLSVFLSAGLSLHYLSVVVLTLEVLTTDTKSLGCHPAERLSVHRAGAVV